MALVHELCRFDSRPVFRFAPGLLHEQVGQVFHLDFYQILTGLFLQKVKEIAVEKATVGPHEDFPNSLGQFAQTLFHEIHSPIARVGRAGSKPVVETFSGFSNKTEKGVIQI